MSKTKQPTIDRAAVWTPEMRAAAAARGRERMAKIEAREKVAAEARVRMQDPSRREVARRVLTDPETRAKNAAAMRAPEVREKLRTARARMTPEQNERRRVARASAGMSAAAKDAAAKCMKEKMANPVFVKKMRAALERPEVRERCSAVKKREMRDPKRRKQLSEIQRARYAKYWYLGVLVSAAELAELAGCPRKAMGLRLRLGGRTPEEAVQMGPANKATHRR